MEVVGEVVMILVDSGNGRAVESYMAVLRCYMTAKWVWEVLARRDLDLRMAVIT